MSEREAPQRKATRSRCVPGLFSGDDVYKIERSRRPTPTVTDESATLKISSRYD